MRKKPTLSHGFFLIGAALLTLLAFVMLFSLSSCKKNDLNTFEIAKTIIDTEQVFFNGHRSGDLTESKLVGYIIRQNEQMDFVKKTVSQIGFPRWNKAITLKKNRNRTTENDQNSDTILYYIPFVRDSQNYVNASMVIKISATDTSFSYLCDWQYSQLQNNPTSINDKAEHYASFFMKLDKIVFGYDKFKINNPRLFNGGFTGPIRVQLVEEANQNERLYSIFSCQNIVVFYRDCPYPLGQCFGNNGKCDDCWRCTSSLQYQYCTETMVDDGGIPGSGGGGSGGGSGGGGTPPPPCGGPQGIAGSRGNEPCDGGPGWEPFPPIEDDPTLPTDPCTVAQLAAKKLDTLYNNGKADSMLNTIPNIATEPNEQGFAIFREFEVTPNPPKDTTFTKYRTSPLVPGSPTSVSANYNIPPRHVVASWVHTHTSIGYPAQSAYDIYLLIQMKLEEPFLVGNLIAASDGSQYGISVTDPALASAFLNTKNVFLDVDKWESTSAIGIAFEAAQNHFLEVYKNNAKRRDLAYEMAMAAVLNQFNTGVTLSKKDASGHFKPIVVKKVIPNPNKPKKVTYVQDCI